MPKVVDPGVYQRTRDHGATVHGDKGDLSTPCYKLGHYPYVCLLQHLKANCPLRAAPVEQRNIQERQVLICL
jgi:hypothetical protein